MERAEIIKNLSQFESPTPPKWREEEEAVRRAETEGWLGYSQRIAVKTAIAMHNQALTQRQLADRMSCSHQYASRLLKGEENISLETIAKIERALNIQILQPQYA